MARRISAAFGNPVSSLSSKLPARFAIFLFTGMVRSYPPYSGHFFSER